MKASNCALNRYTACGFIVKIDIYGEACRILGLPGCDKIWERNEYMSVFQIGTCMYFTRYIGISSLAWISSLAIHRHGFITVLMIRTNSLYIWKRLKYSKVLTCTQKNSKRKNKSMYSTCRYYDIILYHDLMQGRLKANLRWDTNERLKFIIHRFYKKIHIII
jgi:hypothetical protein